MKTAYSATALLVLWLTACTTAPTRVQRSEFEDIPVPRGLSYRADQSTIIESPNVKAARLLYRGRVEPESIGVAMRSTLEMNGWRHVSTSTTSTHGTTQVYEKGGNSLQVQVWEGGLFNWFTYVELTASRAIAASPSAATPTPASTR